MNNQNDVFNILFKLSDDQDQSRLRSSCHRLQKKLSANDSLNINTDGRNCVVYRSIAERSFSKLKLIKNYLRSTMSQKRLTNLATISIEEATLDHIDIHEIIKEFANRKARRVEII
ncbi:unnamed protein product [Parnassius mnemosyne]|uniref:HAT C-terminal dimerisation domain-containing protein n=1 Tax=Parnassius mnemosyne TaxID=213953 RepID=A0AAV1LCZ7_9NEOP